MRTSRGYLLVALLLGAALTVTGCGSKSDSGPAQTKAAGPVKKAANPADSLSQYLVGAVVTGKAGASLLQLKYELAARPEVGDPVDVDLVVVPAADNIDAFSGTIQGDDGLDVVAGGTIASGEKPVYGTPIHFPLKVVARRDGIFMLTANVAVSSAGESQAPVYSMPIIAGNGLADVGATPAAGAKPAKPAPAAAAQ